ncbi:MBL fold metallo-hydrolase [Cytobacillus massiliigabonensis]|uniref:MBL fold metallo-hydrolase n=1 Tax=Cytobacillus massiliigabonensis TaxID=1871011 RepID=UPI000C840B9F|nr:MBL fold metallo-hydrolase [Cytobacillus massiliigabonensis]
MNGIFQSKHFKLEKLRANVYAAIAKEGGGAAANAGFVDLGEKVIVFDTFNTQQASQDLKHLAESITNHPVTWVINSHWHGDHIRGNQTFKDRIIISSESTYTKMKDIYPSRIAAQKNDIDGLTNYIQSLKDHFIQNTETQLQYQINFLSELKSSLPTLELSLPNQTFIDEITFHGQKQSATLFTLGGGHSLCDAMLYIPDEKVIFMGDLLFVNCHPTFFEETDLAHWINILKKVDFMEFDVAVPGHGSAGTKEDILKVIHYISDLTALVREGHPIEEIKIPAKYSNWGSSEVFQQNIKIVEALLNKGTSIM